MVTIFPMTNKIIFELDYEESKRATDWIKKHNKKCKLSSGTIGDKFSYIFTPTGIGIFSTLNCPCGESFNRTDIGNL